MNRLKLIIGTGFGSGLLPYAPGTFGSLLCLLPLWFMLNDTLYFMIPLQAALASVLTIWVSSWFEQKWDKDPAPLVMDEWAGQSLTFIGVTTSGVLATDIVILLSGFLLFRFFDILKPLGIHKLQKAPGGWGILLDDIVAGLYALICLKTLIFFWPQYFGMV